MYINHLENWIDFCLYEEGHRNGLCEMQTSRELASQPGIPAILEAESGISQGHKAAWATG
jgi:hypothetical protein